MNRQFRNDPPSKDKAKNNATSPAPTGRVQTPTIKPGDGKGVLFEFLDLNLKSADYRSLIHETEKDAK